MPSCSRWPHGPIPSCTRCSRSRPEERIELVVVTSDRGLCGSFNTNILKTAVAFLRQREGKTLVLQAVGRKGRDFFRRRPWTIRREYADVLRNVEFALAAEISQEAAARYAAGEVDAVYFVYNEFKSAVGAAPGGGAAPPHRARRGGGRSQDGERGLHLRARPAVPVRCAPSALRRACRSTAALLESPAAEHAARMTAMDSATKNAGELIEALTLTMNRVRQASITTEIIEVVSGAEALG